MSASAARHGKHHLRAREARGVPHRAQYQHRTAWPPHGIDGVQATRHGSSFVTGRFARRFGTIGRALASRNRTADSLRKLKAMWRGITRLFEGAGKLVRALWSARPRLTGVADRSSQKWKGEDFRIICDCQRHAIRERALWRRAARTAAQFKRSGAVLLVGLPLALGTVGIPIGATSGAVVETRSSIPRSADGFRIFTTPKVRSQFLEPQTEPRSLTLEVMKQEFFRRNIPYGSIIYREAKKNHLAPELVAAVVEAESDFRPLLISGKNAQGLMQIVPSTGELLGVGNLFDPEQNIAAGSKYLRYLLDRFDGDLRLAIAAYNAGEGNIEKFGGVPPFPETTSYVQRVSAHTRWYRQRIRETIAASSRVRTSYAH